MWAPEPVQTQQKTKGFGSCRELKTMNQRLSRRGSEVAKPSTLPRLPIKGSSWYNLPACLETTHTQQPHKSFNPGTHNRWQNSTNTTLIIRVSVHGGRKCRLGRSSSLHFNVYYKSFTSKYSPVVSPIPRLMRT